MSSETVADGAAALFESVENTAPLDMQALAVHLGANGHTLDVTVPARQFRGGLANINYLLTVDGVPHVLRRPPDGKLPRGAHDMGREHRILARLHEQLAVAPPSRYLCEDVGVIGVPFQLIEYRPGLIIRGDQLPAALQNPQTTGRVTDVLIDTLVAIHDVDPVAVGLDTLGRPEGFLGRGVAGWIRRSEAFAEDAKVKTVVAELGQWLNHHIDAVPERSPVLLHCDFKLDNLILDPHSLSPVAVIDWDMGTRGDPLFDLATLLSYWTEPDDPPCMHRLAQMPTAHSGFAGREAIAARYSARRGVNLDGFEVIRVLSVFKLGIVFLQLYQRWAESGLGDDRYAGFSELGADLLEFALDVSRGRYF